MVAALRSVRPDLAYLNLAQDNATAAEIRARQLGKALAFQGDLAVVAAGGSDVMSDSFDADATEAELARIVAPLRDAGADVVIVGPLDSGRARRGAEERATALWQQRLRLLEERTHGLALRSGAIHLSPDSSPARLGPAFGHQAGRDAQTRSHAIATAVIRGLGEYVELIGRAEGGRH